MSRIGNKSIALPDKVKCEISPSGDVRVEGPKGKLSWKIPAEISAEIQDQQIRVARRAETRDSRAKQGLTRALIANMVTGVSSGFSRNLEIHGVGFRAAVKGSNLDLNLGYSHPVLFPIPEGIKVTVTDNTKIAIEGIDKQLVGQVAANIRGYYPPEPYKGKGVRYSDEQVRRKEGKKQA